MTTKNNNKYKIFFRYHFPLIIYAATVIILSSIPELGIKKFRFLFVDKAAHFVEYAILSALTFRSFYQIFHKDNINKALILSGAFLIGFATFDEIYQSFIPGRHSDIYDLATDIFGSSLVLILLQYRYKRLNKS